MALDLHKSATFLFVKRSGQWLLVSGWMAVVTLPFCITEKNVVLTLAFGLTAARGLLHAYPV